ncbi:DNA cytosine methyltransferase [Arthrobacter sp. EPSL27]|uniref:DNA cytosine methyltransferase n=1 Tax=Arthrobacter sp. EPSL27 TaxID=1745378 RepID=UPI0009EC7066|nr:DNA cytosine methyltransferase [Arthrobacter sp. EPSL27]
MQVVSLFSGAGGLDLGLLQAGHRVIWANDFDQDSVSTYSANIGKHIVLKSIEDVPSSDIPDSDIVVGGFPCQGFSQANLNRALDDPRNALYRQFVRVLSEKQPKYFIAENVRGLLSLDSGRAFESITKGFEEAGYRVAAKVLNAADFGVPQNRHRVIFMGTRVDLPESANLTHPEPTHSSLPSAEGKLPHVTVGEALAAVPDPIEFPDAVPNQAFSRYKFVERNFTGHRSTDPNKPSPTILARGNGGGGVNATPHPNGLRRMSIRESAAIQTFPLTFNFVGRLGSAYRQVGNAVPVGLGRALGNAVASAEETLLSSMSRSERAA